MDATPVWSESSLRGVTSKIDSLFAVKDAATTTDMERFLDVAKLIPSEANPALELAEMDRWVAGGSVQSLPLPICCLGSGCWKLRSLTQFYLP
ncbi:hypothetical protein [Paraburkholderia fungorum]|uniref:hypothetical protein n=1 Tax=Paraburkholderia fungorum TaxID=134537 RepID=UPI0038B93BBD